MVVILLMLLLEGSMIQSEERRCNDGIVSFYAIEGQNYTLRCGWRAYYWRTLEDARAEDVEIFDYHVVMANYSHKFILNNDDGNNNLDIVGITRSDSKIYVCLKESYDEMCYHVFVLDKSNTCNASRKSGLSSTSKTKTCSFLCPFLHPSRQSCHVEPRVSYFDGMKYASEGIVKSDYLPDGSILVETKDLNLNYIEDFRLNVLLSCNWSGVTYQSSYNYTSPIELKSKCSSSKKLLTFHQGAKILIITVAIFITAAIIVVFLVNIKRSRSSIKNTPLSSPPLEDTDKYIYDLPDIPPLEADYKLPRDCIANNTHPESTYAKVHGKERPSTLLRHKIHFHLFKGSSTAPKCLESIDLAADRSGDVSHYSFPVRTDSMLKTTKEDVTTIDHQVIDETLYHQLEIPPTKPPRKCYNSLDESS